MFLLYTQRNHSNYGGPGLSPFEARQPESCSPAQRFTGERRGGGGWGNRRAFSGEITRYTVLLRGVCVRVAAAIVSEFTTGACGVRESEKTAKLIQA